MFTAEQIEAYLQEKLQTGVSENAARKYRTPLYALHHWLGNDKTLSAERLQQWRSELEQSDYSKYSVQSYVKVVNGYLRHYKLDALCIPKPLRVDLTGRTFGYLTVIGTAEQRQRRNIVWQCQCKCGNQIKVTTAMLLSGKTASCGCLKQEILQHNNRYVEGTELRKALHDEPLNQNNTSGYTGVQPKGDKWIAYITYKKKKYHLGTFYTLEDAVKARARAKKLVMEDAQRLYELTDELYRTKPQKPAKPVKEQPKVAEMATCSDTTSGCTGAEKQYGK